VATTFLRLLRHRLQEKPIHPRAFHGVGRGNGVNLGVGGGGRSKVDVTRGVLGDPRGIAGGATQTTPTPTTKSKQRTGQKRDRVGVLFRFGIMEPPPMF
jgi:hypothetical protein